MFSISCGYVVGDYGHDAGIAVGFALRPPYLSCGLVPYEHSVTLCTYEYVSGLAVFRKRVDYVSGLNGKASVPDDRLAAEVRQVDDADASGFGGYPQHVAAVLEYRRYELGRQTSVYGILAVMVYRAAVCIQYIYTMSGRSGKNLSFFADRQFHQFGYVLVRIRYAPVFKVDLGVCVVICIECLQTC